MELSGVCISGPVFLYMKTERINPMKKILIALLAALPLIIFLSACDEGASTPADTQSSGDWRNKIEYEGNFYVDSSTKLLYALDRGTITLWDNAGDGEKLQTLEYNSAESGAIESLEIADVNGDGANDISTVFSENEEGTKYNLWLWNTNEGKYTECKLYRNINDPVISEDKTTVRGTLDKGIFGVVTTTYAFTETLTLDPVSTVIAGADNIAAGISAALCNGAPVSLTEGAATVQSIPCTVYAATADGKQTAYIAHTEDASWFVDIGCVGAYRMVDGTEGAYTAGLYVDEAGELADICAELYGCETSSLTVSRITMGILESMAYDEEGNIIVPETDDGETELIGLSAQAFTFMLGGKELCTIAKAENTSYYCYDTASTGDNYYYMISAAGETEFVPMTACIYHIQ